MADPRIDDVPLTLPREAITPRQVVRPVAVWRLLQEAAVQSSSRRGWPPQRYASSGIGFVLARMTVQHHRELRDGEAVSARTWVRSFRRRMISDREIRLDGSGERVAVASQRWVHVSSALRLVPASDAFIASFPLTEVPDEPGASLPELPEAAGPVHTLELPCWHAWLDPLGHVNHPTYLQWCDEHTSRLLAAAGQDPVSLAPVAEEITYRSGVSAGDHIRVQTTLAGASADGRTVRLHHTITAPDRELVYARAVTIRRLADGGALVSLFSSGDAGEKPEARR